MKNSSHALLKLAGACGFILAVSVALGGFYVQEIMLKRGIHSPQGGYQYKFVRSGIDHYVTYYELIVLNASYLAIFTCAMSIVGLAFLAKMRGSKG